MWTAEQSRAEVRSAQTGRQAGWQIVELIDRRVRMTGIEKGEGEGEGDNNRVWNRCRPNKTNRPEQNVRANKKLIMIITATSTNSIATSHHFHPHTIIT